MQNANQGGKQQTIRVNWLIKSVDVRVIDGDGNNLGVMKTSDAIGKARELGVDLIEINGKSNPPVAKLMELGKFKFDEKKKAAEAKRNTFVLETKELQIRGATSGHDTLVKVKQALEFLDEGHRVKWTVKMRGRENANAHVSFDKLKEVLAMLGEKVVVLNEPKSEAKAITMIVVKEK
jgi:translation initiation factor IF-3